MKNLCSFFTHKEKGYGTVQSLSREFFRNHPASIRVFSEEEKGTSFVLEF
jgi:C4-dicarboxylate-specific signal transduction histidine kinase